MQVFQYGYFFDSLWGRLKRTADSTEFEYATLTDTLTADLGVVGAGDAPPPEPFIAFNRT